MQCAICKEGEEEHPLAPGICDCKGSLVYHHHCMTRALVSRYDHCCPTCGKSMYVENPFFFILIMYSSCMFNLVMVYDYPFTIMSTEIVLDALLNFSYLFKNDKTRYCYERPFQRLILFKQVLVAFLILYKKGIRFDNLFTIYDYIKGIPSYLLYLTERAYCVVEFTLGIENIIYGIFAVLHFNGYSEGLVNKLIKVVGVFFFVIMG